MNPLLNALRELGGSGSIDEIYERVIQDLQLSEEVLSVLHDREASNHSRGVWSLTKPDLTGVDPKVVVKTVRENDKKDKKAKADPGIPPAANETEAPDEAQTWRAKLYHILTKGVDPSSFERLIQRLLRESGFVQVEVTGRTGDGGIDGKGIARIHGFMSFHVVFQCKRYQGIVSSSHIRDFRCAMVGRADKGLFITTGTFSRDAIKEASRDGAPPIDLVDGDQLAVVGSGALLGV
jgi:restriction system protein